MHNFFEGLNTPDGLFLIHRPNRLAHPWDDRRRLHACANHDRARLSSLCLPLVCLFVQEINCGSRLFPNAHLANSLHDADDRVPVALFVKLPELEPCTKRAASWKILTANDSLTIATGDSERRSEISKKRPSRRCAPM